MNSFASPNSFADHGARPILFLLQEPRNLIRYVLLMPNPQMPAGRGTGRNQDEPHHKQHGVAKTSSCHSFTPADCLWHHATRMGRPHIDRDQRGRRCWTTPNLKQKFPGGGIRRQRIVLRSPSTIVRRPSVSATGHPSRPRAFGHGALLVPADPPRAATWQAHDGLRRCSRHPRALRPGAAHHPWLIPDLGQIKVFIMNDRILFPGRGLPQGRGENTYEYPDCLLHT